MWCRMFIGKLLVRQRSSYHRTALRLSMCRVPPGLLRLQLRGSAGRNAQREVAMQSELDHEDLKPQPSTRYCRPQFANLFLGGGSKAVPAQSWCTTETHG